MSQQLTLSDGRKLDYTVFNKSSIDNPPLLWFHGTPGSSLPPPGLADACAEHEITGISFCRPGYGTSTRSKGRRVVDTMKDVAELLKHLDYTRFYAGGWSGGGPYTLASAATIPGCIAGFTVAGVGPYDAPGLDWLDGQGQGNKDEMAAALRGEPELQAFVKPQREELLGADVPTVVAALSSVLPEVDKKALLEDAGLSSYLVDSLEDSLKAGTDGWVDDDLAFIQPWGFDLESIKVPVFIHQGSEDKMVPFAHGKWIAEHVTTAVPHLEEGEGHLSIYLGRVGHMIGEVVSVGNS